MSDRRAHRCLSACFLHIYWRFCPVIIDIDNAIEEVTFDDDLVMIDGESHRERMNKIDVVFVVLPEGIDFLICLPLW